MFVFGIVVFCVGLYGCIGLRSADDLEQAALQPFADDPQAARNMSAATGRVCARVITPQSEFACERPTGRLDA
ncbi:hypothetical protein NVV93_14030 [Pseudomonas sp. LS44]|uniref:hypothetical protein n=1 Tax=Pseudomonas sp. LS44 TaxID=1357074 RepID=UPI00215A6BD3|nr:hypothetical protein [Pseudomonas sp. LS44]UVE16712.1 hypothetical protein NVV93_14030 [Pseudomonas sp. LS44]